MDAKNNISTKSAASIIFGYQNEMVAEEEILEKFTNEQAFSESQLKYYDAICRHAKFK